MISRPRPSQVAHPRHFFRHVMSRTRHTGHMPDSDAERSRRYRRHRQGDHSLCRHDAAVAVFPAGGRDGAALVAAYRRELDEAKVLDTPTAALVLELAERLAGGDLTGSALAALSRELRAAMADATRNKPGRADVLDELLARRRARQQART